MDDKDYTELSEAISKLQKAVEALQNEESDRLFRVEEMKILHQKVLEDLSTVTQENNEGLTHLINVYRLAKSASVPDREDTFQRIKQWLKETQNR